MSSILNATHTTTSQATIPSNISKENVLSLLHNPEKMILLNPIVKSHHHLPDASPAFFAHEPEAYKPTPDKPVPVYQVTEDMSGSPDGEPAGGTWRGGWAKRFVPDSITYETSMQNREDGLVAITHAPMGVHSVTTWVVDDAGEGGGLVLRETGCVTSNRMLMGFIKTTLQDSHDKLVKDFVAFLVKESERV